MKKWDGTTYVGGGRMAVNFPVEPHNLSNFTEIVHDIVQADMTT